MKIINIIYTPLKNYNVIPGLNPLRVGVGERGVDLEDVFEYLKSQNLKKRAFQVRVNLGIPEEDRQVLEARLKQNYPKFSGIAEITNGKH